MQSVDILVQYKKFDSINRIIKNPQYKISQETVHIQKSLYVRTDGQMLQSQQPFLANLRTHPKRSAQFHSHSTFRHDSRSNIQTRAAVCLLAFCCFWIANNFVNYIQNDIQHPAVKVTSICRGNYWETSGWISRQQVQLLIMHCAFVKYLRKSGNTMKQFTSYL